MISVLAQERLLGAALGGIFTGIVVFEQRRCIYNSISGANPLRVSQITEPIFGRKSRAELAHLWNRAVDQTFRPVIESLSSSGWTPQDVRKIIRKREPEWFCSIAPLLHCSIATIGSCSLTKYVSSFMVVATNSSPRA